MSYSDDMSDAAALVNKLEKAAALTNEDLLSDEEISRGHAILSLDSEYLLRLQSNLSPDTSALTAKVAERVSNLRVALAPHKRLPVDILGHIFLLFHPKVGRSQNPGSLFEAPWILGQVCRGWRGLSRSMPTLWGTIKVSLNRSNRRIIERAALTLPVTAKLLVYVAAIGFDDFVRDGLFPYLYRVDELEWTLFRTTEKQLLDLLPHRALSHVVILKLHFEYTAHNIDYFLSSTAATELFGKASRLAELQLTSDTSHLLMLDIPWYQLTSLTLCQDNPHLLIYAEAEDTWAEIGHLLPSSNHFSRLQSLNLVVCEQVLPITLSYDLPWQQLTSFRVKILDSSHLSLVVEVLEQCASLIDLALDIPFERDSDVPYQRPSIAPFIIHSPMSFHLSGCVPQGLIQSGSLWNRLCKLSMDSIYLTMKTFHDIVSHFWHIEVLDVSFDDEGSESRLPPHICLPHLHTFVVRVYGCRIFTILMTPALIKFNISTSRTFDLGPISDHMNRSKCQILDFSLAYYGDGLENTYGLNELLWTIPYCTSFRSYRVVLSGDLTNDIATGTLLPRLNSVDIAISEWHAYLTMVQLRLEMEKRLGYIRLRHFCGSAPGLPGVEIRDGLQIVERKYDVVCKLVAFLL